MSHHSGKSHSPPCTRAGARGASFPRHGLKFSPPVTGPHRPSRSLRLGFVGVIVFKNTPLEGVPQGVPRIHPERTRPPHTKHIPPAPPTPRTTDGPEWVQVNQARPAYPCRSLEVLGTVCRVLKESDTKALRHVSRDSNVPVRDRHAVTRAPARVFGTRAPARVPDQKWTKWQKWTAPKHLTLKSTPGRLSLCYSIWDPLCLIIQPVFV